MTRPSIEDDEPLLPPMSQQEHEQDDLEKHRERVRELIDEHRSVFDNLDN